jgi:hypothetical protein
LKISRNVYNALTRYGLFSKRLRVALFTGDPDEAYLYAKYVTKKRTPEIEPYILKDPENAFLYARNVLGWRWVEAEPFIKQDPTLWEYYQRYFNPEYKGQDK